MVTAATVESAPVEQLVAPRGSPCPKCGSLIEPGEKFCHACGTPVAPADKGSSATPAAPEKRRFRCKNCSAEVLVDPDQRSFTCPFCDSTYVFELPTAETQRQPPEFVIGFAVTLQQAAERYQTWLRQGGWFCPGDLGQAQIHDKLRGVYLPFWSFSMLAESRWSAQIGEYWYRTETYTVIENGKSVTRTREVRETEWWGLSGQHHSYYSGYLVSGSKGLPQIEADKIKPFQLPAMKRYDASYLAGWFSEEYSIEKEAAQATCEAEFTAEEQKAIGGFLPGDTFSGLSVQTEFSEINSDLVLLPVYLLTYRYGEKLFRIAINGQTGRIAGKKPLSGKRIGIAIAGGVLLLAALWFLFMWLSHRH
jgi:hypothetical protein